ncbi:MAG: hypothetical protein HC910_12895 [Spirulinaceae cyanobacterium SM2_1_0]|nr:hypothetical protein [Spirulinaceae cyanobacterium SM2_1_0]
MSKPQATASDRRPETLSPPLRQLHEISVYQRWLWVGCCWLLLAPFALWTLREGIALAFAYFTWSAVYYHLATHFWATISLALCIGSTTAVLVWQSRNILFGLSRQDLRRLERQRDRLQRLGRRHPLWHWVEKGDRA